MASVLRVTIHSEISEFPTEKRYDANIKISELKKKLELITGANHNTMKIILSTDDKQQELDNNDESLAHYAGEQISKDSVLKLIVKDEQPSKIFADCDVPKYTISEEKYQERPDNVRNFIKEIRQKQTSDQ